MTDLRPCPMTLTAGGPCPGSLFDSGIPGMDQCSHCGTWVGRPSLPTFTVTDDQNMFGLPEGATITFTPNLGQP